MLTSLLFSLTLVACPPPEAAQPPPAVQAALTPAERGEQVRDSAAALESAGRFTGSRVGYGAPSPVYRDYKALLAIADDSDLETLLSHPSPVVRLYAMQGLLRRGHDAEALYARLSDKAQRVRTQDGCMAREASVDEVARRLMKRR